MKKPIQRIVLAGFASTLLSACGYNINPYGASVQNVETIKAQNIKPVAVSNFTTFEAGLNSIGCRAAGPVQTPNEMPFEKVIEKALIDELKLAGVYDTQAPLIIKGHLEYINFNSNIGSGKWSIKLNVSSNKNPEGFMVETQHEFSTNWVADKACQQVAQAFGPALQDLIGKVVAHPMFKTMGT